MVQIVNYLAAFRNTGSAITEKLSEPEFLDPIIYSTHPDVVAKKAEYKASGSLADQENSSMLFSYFPGWMQEEDEQNGKQLKYLAQVLGSYFDTLWHQINFVDKIHDNHYISGSNKALPFAKNCFMIVVLLCPICLLMQQLPRISSQKTIMKFMKNK